MPRASHSIIISAFWLSESDNVKIHILRLVMVPGVTGGVMIGHQASCRVRHCYKVRLGPTNSSTHVTVTNNH